MAAVASGKRREENPMPRFERVLAAAAVAPLDQQLAAPCAGASTANRPDPGVIENLAMQLASGTRAPRGDKAVLLVFADHGLTEEGVSQYPLHVVAMVMTYLAGRASAVPCRRRNATICVVVPASPVPPLVPA